MKLKVKAEYLGTKTKVYFDRPESGGAHVGVDLDTATQEELEMIVKASGGSHPMIAEDKKADKA